MTKESQENWLSEEKTASIIVATNFVTSQNRQNFDSELHMAQAGLLIFQQLGFVICDYDEISLAAEIQQSQTLPQELVLASPSIIRHYIIYDTENQCSKFCMSKEPLKEQVLIEFDLDDLINDSQKLMDDFKEIVEKEQTTITLDVLIEGLMNLEDVLTQEDLDELIDFVDKIEQREGIGDEE